MHNQIDFDQLSEKFKFLHIDNIKKDYQTKSIFGYIRYFMNFYSFKYK